LYERIYSFLKNSNSVIKTQALWRGFMVRKWLKLHGPAWKNRSLCVNEQDFLSFEDLTELNIDQFFSYKNKENFVYGFDIVSIYNLIKSSQEKSRNNKDKILNPYDRKEIDEEVIKNLKRMIKFSKMLKRDVSIEIPKEETENEEELIKGRIVNVFQNIDLLGHYTQSEWFSNLNLMKLKRFLKELCDIWTYRAQLQFTTKVSIFPPSGDPFQNIYGGSYTGLVQINSVTNILELQRNCLTVIERMVNYGLNDDYKNLGAYYVLTALTLVSEQAASALPWLFEAASSVGI